MNQHLDRARAYIEKGDGFYAKAAAEISAARDDGVKWKVIAASLDRSSRWCQILVESYKNAKPGSHFQIDWQRGSHATADEIDDGARRLLADAPEKVVEDLPDEKLAEVAEAVESENVRRRLYQDRPRPTVDDAARRARKDEAQRQQADPVQALVRLGTRIGDTRATVRVLVAAYQDFRALAADDEEILEAGRERLVALHADVEVALSEATSGSIEDALARLTTEGVQ